MKTLIDKIKSVGRKAGRGIKRGLLVATAVASLGVAGCDLGGNKPEPNYAPEAELYVNPTSVVKDASIDINLNGADNDGIEDIVEYKIEIDKGNDGTIEETITKPNPILATKIMDYAGGVKIFGQVKDSAGAVDRKSIDVIVSDPSQPNVIIQGYLQDNETDTNQPGEVRLYIDGVHSQTDNDGEYFSFLVPRNSNVKLKGMIKDGTGAQKSYVRTETRENVTSDLSNVLVRAVPYPINSNPSFNVSPEDFKMFMNQTNSSYAGLRGFDLSQIQGIEILRGDPLGGDFNFSEPNQNSIKQDIENPNNINLYVEKKDLNGVNPGWIDVQLDDNLSGQDPANKHYSKVLVNDKMTIKPDNGWIIVTPHYNANSETSFFWDFDGGKIQRARIDLGVVNETVPTHEFGHAFIASNPLTYGHSTVLPNPFTIMTATNLKSPPPGVADEKAAKIVYEDSYQYGENLDNILGTDF